MNPTTPRTDIEAGDLVVGIPSLMCSQPETHGNYSHEDTSTDHKLHRVASVGLDPNGFPFLTLKGDSEHDWCAGCFRKIRPVTQTTETKELVPA